jgi:acetoin utilization protein AcuB
MTPFPYAISASKKLTEAREMMTSHDIRHLPVKGEGGALLGVLGWEDLRVATALAGASAEVEVRVGDICTRAPCIVDLNTSLDAVVTAMAGLHARVALVTRADKLVGILTLTDICELLASMLRGASPPDEPA